MLAALYTMTCYTGPGYVQGRGLAEDVDKRVAEDVHKGVDNGVVKDIHKSIAAIQMTPVAGSVSSLVQLRLPSSPSRLGG